MVRETSDYDSHLIHIHVFTYILFIAIFHINISRDWVFLLLTAFNFKFNMSNLYMLVGTNLS